jgi:hypothetical protein
MFLVIMVGTLLASTNLFGQRVYASHSVLATGNWTQLAVTREGVLIQFDYLEMEGRCFPKITGNPEQMI